MKDIMAIIRINKMNETKKALEQAGITSMTATGRVLGRGKGNVDYRILNGAKEGREEAIAQLNTNGPRLIPKRLISVVVPEALVKKTVAAIIKANQTGMPGDGKIFVLPVLESHRVRTAESGDKVLDE
ncbi:MAG: P-II family nitrogen regulator [Candidatus Omnitrophota bacterium]